MTLGFNNFIRTLSVMYDHILFHVCKPDKISDHTLNGHKCVCVCVCVDGVCVCVCVEGGGEGVFVCVYNFDMTFIKKGPLNLGPAHSTHPSQKLTSYHPVSLSPHQMPKSLIN